MKRLETELETELFTRTCNSMTLNKSGVLVYEFAKRTLRELRILKTELGELSDKRQSVRIGSVAPAPLWLLSSLLIGHQSNIAIEPAVMDENAVERALINQDIDYGITLRQIDLPNMTSEPLMTENLFVFAPKESHFAQRDAVSFHDLEGKSFVVPGGVGIWIDILKRNLPTSKLVIQPDATVFQQTLAASDALLFTTDSPYATHFDKCPDDRRVAVPVADADAHARYYVTKRDEQAV